MVASSTSRKLLPNDGGRRAAQILVVLVPDQDVDEVRFSRTIRNAMLPDTTHIVLLTTVKNVESELAARRRLATISSQVSDFYLYVEMRIVWNRSWIAAAREIAGECDRIACPPEIIVRTGLRKYEPLDAAIAHSLGLPVTPLPGFFTKSPPSFSHALRRIGYWLVILAIVSGFFLLESDAAQSTPGWIGQLIVVLLMVCELGLIYLWTAITG
jgi:hypothetical protein